MNHDNKIFNRNEVENSIKKYFSRQEAVLTIYIFGSFNKENFNNNSDIDLSLIYSERISKLEKFDLKLKFMAELEKIIGRNIDIIDFDDADPKLKHQILNGKLIYCVNHEKRIELEKKAILNYIDMKRFYDIYEKNLGKRF